ncbi:hypothetical protein BCF44_112398 [Kutzneria buriramensis]|uniref:Transcriptional regulator with AbiEi antitoxin domain of type IV toxin-antitoxin system n=1 Tax=Kutzneria buriramensis TaxID=1045776 RepID=A0A3E0HB92_9PSEU|nr:hypothetical protein BCF44_112398 [Kutzneria buriramensis]
MAAFAAVGIGARPPTASDTATDLLLDIHGTRLAVDVKAVATATPEIVAKWLRTPRSSVIGSAHLVVADRVVAGARQLLADNGWGWLDLRGQLRLISPGIHIDTNVPATAQPMRRPRLFAGKVTLEVAASLLLTPDQPASIRRLARELDRSPSSISAAVSALRNAQLLDDGHLPIVPDLFWETADAWRPATTTVSRIDILHDPAITEVLRTAWDDVTGSSGWALTDTLAAAAYGAPAGVRADYPPDFYVPDEATAHRAATMLGVPMSDAARGATLHVAPAPQVCATRRPARDAETHWPLAHPLFVALDLASDPGRGREILDGWTPPSDVARVW